MNEENDKQKWSKSLYADRESMNRCLKNRHASSGQNGKPESTVRLDVK